MWDVCAGGSVQEGGAGHDGQGQAARAGGGAQPNTGDIAVRLLH